MFLGELSEDPKLRVTDKNIVGSVFVFANNSEETGCGNWVLKAFYDKERS